MDVKAISENLQSVLRSIPNDVRLVAVSKYHPIASLREAYECGQRIFGESKVQEMSQKHELLPKDIEWHFIGHLQTNKVKYIAPYVALIHGVDSLKLLSEINRQGEKINRVIPCLLQIHIAKEDTKFGFSFEECRQMFKTDNWRLMKNIQLCGMMGMASNVNDESVVKEEFKTLSDFFQEIKNKYFLNDITFCELSMGMSSDYLLAIREGSTLVRIGSIIFGERKY